MRIKHSLLSLLAVVFFVMSAQAQNYEHTTLWARLTLTTPLSKKVDFQFEYIHRSQNNYHISRWNPLSHESLEEPRLWLFFKQKNYTIQCSPFTYFYSERLLGKEADFAVPPNHIFQTTLGVELRQEKKKWTVKERIHYEYRFLKSLDYVPTGRLRLRGTVQYQIATKTKLQVIDEVFLNMPPHKLTHNFEQNWFIVGIARQINDHFNFDIGIMRNYIQRPNGTEFDHETALTGGINFRIF